MDGPWNDFSAPASTAAPPPDDGPWKDFAPAAQEKVPEDPSMLDRGTDLLTKTYHKPLILSNSQKEIQGPYAEQSVSNPEPSFASKFEQNFENNARNGTLAGSLSNLLAAKAENALPDLPNDDRAQEADEFAAENGPSWTSAKTPLGRVAAGAGALAGSLAGSLTSPESWFGGAAAVPSKDAIVNTARVGLTQAGINTFADPAIQSMNIASGKQSDRDARDQSDLELAVKQKFPVFKDYNLDELAQSPKFGFILGAAVHGSAELTKAAMRWINGRNDASYFDVENPNNGTGPGAPPQLPGPAPAPPRAALPAPRNVPNEFVSDEQGGARPLTETEKWQASPSDILVPAANGQLRPMTQAEQQERTARMQDMQASGNTPDVQRAAAARAASQEPPAVQQAKQTLQTIAETGKPAPPPAPPQADQTGMVPKPPDVGPLQWNDHGVPSRAPVEPQSHVADQPVNTQPTEAQKEAGNYTKGHLNVQGLPITIENPAGSMRSGIGPEGPWQTKMPVDYGYIKGTTGADGDHVDAFIGPNPQSQKVFVVDQKDPATGDFDEHKALVGFDDPFSALNAYEGSFSDGSAGARIGGFTPMEMPQFKDWLKNHDTTEPVNYMPPAKESEFSTNLSAATGTIPGIDNLVKSANNGNVKDAALLHHMANESVSNLVSGIPSARLEVDKASGLYGGSLEPSLAIKMKFDEADRPAALAALAKFAENYNQEQVHVRTPAQSGDRPGQKFPDGSFITPVYRYDLNKPMSRSQIEHIAEKSGLAGFTATDKYLETYYTGEPDDKAALDEFYDGTGKAEELLGTNNGSHRTTLARLWKYGTAVSPYDRIRGDLPATKGQPGQTPRLIGERHVGRGIDPTQHAPITDQQRDLQTRIAQSYDQLPENDLGNPIVRKAYEALGREVKDQYENLPIKVEAWDKEDEKPYENSAAMRRDMADNNHLWVYATTPDTFGPKGSDFKDHPLLQDSGLKDINGHPLLLNDLLRAVHDYYAHGISPVDFGPKGEEAAWRNHMASTKDPLARWALTSETRGQNSWVNFRPGVEGKTLTDRPYAQQKAALLPIHYAMTGDPKIDAPMKALIKNLDPVERNGSLQSQAERPSLSEENNDKSPQSDRKYISEQDKFQQYMGDTRPGTTEFYNKIGQYVVDRGRQTGNEHAVLFDRNTDVVVDAATSGEKTNIYFSPKAETALLDKGNAIELHHNHPSDVPLSPKDITILAGNGISAVVAHTHSGSLTTAKLTPEVKGKFSNKDWDVASNQMRNLITNAQAAIRNSLQEAIDKEKINIDDAKKVFQDLINRSLDKAGIIEYNSSHSFYKNFDDVAAKAIAKAINDGAVSAYSLAKNYGLKGGLNEVKTGNNAGRQSRSELHVVPKEEGLAKLYNSSAGSQGSPQGGRSLSSNSGQGLGESPSGTGKGEISLSQNQSDFGKIIKNGIDKVEEYLNKKFSGTFVERAAEAYQHMLAPESVSDKAVIADALTAQMKVKEQNAASAISQVMQKHIDDWDKKSQAEQKAWIKDYETGKRGHPYDAVHKAWMDATHKEESAAIGRDPDDYYRDNYVAHLFEKPDAVRQWMDSQIKKYGQDWFTKKRSFDLVEEAEKAGFKLETYNPAELDQMRMMAGSDMIQKMRLLRNFEKEGLAAQKSSKTMPPELRDSKNVMAIIGPDGKHWLLHGDIAPLWRNAMEQRGLWGDKTILGDAYRAWQHYRQFMLPIKLGLSLFHPLHVYTIHWGTGISSAFENAIKAQNIGDATKGFVNGIQMALKGGIGKEGVNPGRFLTTKGSLKQRMQSMDSPLLQAVRTLPSQRTPWQKSVVQRFEEGGFRPQMSEKDKIKFRRPFMQALNSKQFHKLLFPAASAAVRSLGAPFMEHWIPAMKAQAYMMRTEMALRRDPSLANDAARRAVVFRQIAKDTERTYGEMNYDTLFWNKTLRDATTGSFISAGWKLAQLYYYMGHPAVQIPKLLRAWAKTGKMEFTAKGMNALRQQVNYQSLFYLAYMTLSLAAGGALTYLLTDQPPQNRLDMQYPRTGDLQPDGTPVRISLPFFNKEYDSWKYNVDQKGPMMGTASFVGNMMMPPEVIHTLNNEDAFGNPLIDNFNWEELSHAAMNELQPISMSLAQRAELKGSEKAKYMSFLGAGTAPAYAGQTTFQNKVAGEYFRQHPPTSSQYQKDLESDYKIAVMRGDQKAQDELAEKLEKTGMSGKQIGSLSAEHRTPFTEYAWKGAGSWKGLSAESQIRLYKYATPDEKKTYFPMMKNEAKSQVEPPQ